MSRNSAPQFRRMPGSAILTMLFLGFVALLHFAGGNALMELNAPVGVLVLLFGFVNLALAIGIGGRKPWAGMGTPVWCGLMIILLVIVSIEQGSTNPTPFSGLLGLYVLVAVFAVRKNTLAWCNRVPERGSGFLSIDRDPEDEEEPNFSDRVELLVVLEEYGLRSGAVGTIVDMRDDPTSFEVEFVDDRTETTTRVSLRPDQLRFLPETR